MSNMRLEKYMSGSSLDVNPSVLDESILDESIIYRAGAGAGKTTQLICQIQDYAMTFYQKHNRWPKVIVTTFTRKTTQELKERLILKAITDGQRNQKPDNNKTSDENLTFQDDQFNFLQDFLLSHQIHISTIDGLLSVFLKQCAFEAGYDPEFQMIDEVNNKEWAYLIIRRLLKEQPEFQRLLHHLCFSKLQNLCFKYMFSFYTVKDLKPASLEDLIELQDGLQADEKAGKQIDKKVTEYIYPKDRLKGYADYFYLFDKFAQKFIRGFEGIKKDQGLMSMSDLQFVTLKILKNQPYIIKSFSREWDYWLIDEYQDTTPMQAEILDTLRGASKEFIVGDPQQSIYLFRGARSEVFESKQAAIKNIRILDKNYRAHPSLVYFFNDFFQNMKTDSSNKGFLPSVPRSLNDKSSDPVAVFVRYGSETQKEKTSEKSDEVNLSKTSLSGKDNHDSAVIAEVIDLRKQGASYSDICIIGRKNDDLLRIGKKLAQYSIPYQLFASQETPVRQIRELNSVLKFILNPYDNLNFIELIRTPWMNFSSLGLNLLINQNKIQKAKSLWQTLLSLSDDESISGKPVSDESVQDQSGQLDRDQLKNLRTELQTLLTISNELGVTEAFKRVCLRMIDFYRVSDSYGDLEAHIWKYFVKLQSEGQRAGFNYLQFASDMITPSSIEPDSLPSLETNRVQLMTVHKSKGLEFEHVLIPHISDSPKTQTTAEPFCVLEDRGLWDIALKNQEDTQKHSLLGYLAVEDMKEREGKEHNRLLYVAMTRAKKSVHFFCCADKKLRKEDKSWYTIGCFDQWIDSGRVGRQDLTHYSYEIKDFDGQIPSVEVHHQEVIDVPIKEKWQKDHQKHSGVIRTSVSALLEKLPAKGRRGASLADQDQIIQRQHYLLQAIKKMDLGTSYHKILQALCLNPYMIRKAPDKIIKNYFLYHFQKDQQKDIIESLEFLLSLRQPPIKELLSGGYSEWSFLHRVGDQAVEGKIDLWGIVDGVLWVVDYKTGFMSDDKKASRQLRFYGQALAERYKQDIKLAAIYLLEQKVAFYP